MKRITVLVGAGASQVLELPGTDDVTRKLVEKERTEIASGFKLEGSMPYPPIFAEVLDILNRCHTPPNFEHLLHALECLTSMFETEASPKGRYKAIELLFTNGMSDRARSLIPVSYTPGLAATLLYLWLCEIFEKASAAAHSGSRWTSYADFWRTLAGKFTLDVATLNYDTCLEQAFPQFDQGFRPMSGTKAQRFDGLSFRSQRNPRLMHLHGSILFGGWDQNASISRPAYEDTWEDLYYYSEQADATVSRQGSKTDPISQAGRESIIGAIITGLQKPDKVLFAEPYMTYYRALAENLESCPRLLVIGYGFGDRHINALLERMPRWHGSARRIACIDYTRTMDQIPSKRHVPTWIDNGILTSTTA
jgi:hypothetical protein